MFTFTIMCDDKYLEWTTSTITITETTKFQWESAKRRKTQNHIHLLLCKSNKITRAKALDGFQFATTQKKKKEATTHHELSLYINIHTDKRSSPRLKQRNTHWHRWSNNILTYNICWAFQKQVNSHHQNQNKTKRKKKLNK